MKCIKYVAEDDWYKNIPGHCLGQKIYLAVDSGLYLWTGRNFSEQVGHNVFEVQKGRSSVLCVLVTGIRLGHRSSAVQYKSKALRGS